MKKAVESGLDRVEDKVEDKVVGGATTALWSIYGPHPGLAIVRFWQGIVELCISIAIIVLSFAALVAACVAITDVSIDTAGVGRAVMELVQGSRDASGFVIFVTLLIMLWELGLIVFRFLNFGIINRFFTATAIVVMVFLVVLAVLLFSGGVVAGVEGEEWREQIETWESQGVDVNERAQRIPRNLAATSAFAILTVVALVFQWVWLLLFLLFDWNKNIHTTLIFSGVAKGIANEVKEAL